MYCYTGLIDLAKIVGICAMLVRDGSLSPFIDVPIDILSVHKLLMKEFFNHCVDSFVPQPPVSVSIPRLSALGLVELNPQCYQAASGLNVFGTIAAGGLLLIRTWVLLVCVLACLIGPAAAYTAGSGVVGGAVLRSMK